MSVIIKFNKVPMNSTVIGSTPRLSPQPASISFAVFNPLNNSPGPLKKVSDYTTTAVTSSLTAQSVCSSVFDKLFDGSYKTAVTIACPNTTEDVHYTSRPIYNEKPTSIEEALADPRVQTNRQLIAEFENKRLREGVYKRKKLSKAMNHTIKLYKRTLRNLLYYERLLSEPENLPANSLKSKEINRDNISFKLQLCEIDIVRIDLIYEIEDKYYPAVIQTLKELDDPYNVKSEIPPIKAKFDKVIGELYDMLLKLEYLDHEKTKIEIWLQNHSLKVKAHDGSFKYLINRSIQRVT